MDDKLKVFIHAGPLPSEMPQQHGQVCNLWKNFGGWACNSANMSGYWQQFQLQPCPPPVPLKEGPTPMPIRYLTGNSEAETLEHSSCMSMTT